MLAAFRLSGLRGIGVAFTWVRLFHSHIVLSEFFRNGSW